MLLSQASLEPGSSVPSKFRKEGALGRGAPISLPVLPRVNRPDRKLAPRKGKDILPFIRVTMLKVSQLGEGLEAKIQPPTPPNKIMNGPAPQQYGTVVEEGTSSLLTNGKVRPPVPRKQTLTMPAFLRRGSSSPGLSPGSQPPLSLILGQLVLHTHCGLLPQGKAGSL